jgi:site-specific recombinase XerD
MSTQDSTPRPAVVDRFAGEYFSLNSTSEGRCKMILFSLARLQRHTGKPLEETTDADLRGWLVHLLTDEGLAPSTVGRSLWEVRPFFGWAWQSQIIDAEHYMRIKQVQPPRGSKQQVPRPYTRKQLAQMWAQLEAKYPRLPAAPRDKRSDLLARWRKGTSPYASVKTHFMRVQLEAMIELALVCGLRRAEIYALTIDDVHWDNEYILVHGKRHNQNDRLRDVPYPDSTRKVIKEWLRLRTMLDATTNRVWLSATGPVPNAEMDWNRVHNILHSFGRWEFHRLRHTCATERLRAGMELEKLSRFLGHATIGQTLGYAQLVRSDIHRASEQTDAQFQRAIRPRQAA